MSSRVKSWLLLSVIFIAGVVTGSALTYGLGPHFARPPNPQQMKRLWMIQLVQRLNLTADQQAKIQPILAEAETRIQNLHREEVDGGARIIKETDNQIAAVLTPAQNAELQKMEEEREKRFADHLRLRNSQRDRDGGSPDDMRPHDDSDGGGVPPPPPPPAPPTNAAPARS